MCKITLGRLIQSGRRNLGLTQRELADKLALDFYLLSKIENDRIQLTSELTETLLPKLADIFEIELEYVELLFNQTQPVPLDLSKGIFFVHYHQLL